jgi:small acid-soluble spore protein I (minor)
MDIDLRQAIVSRVQDKSSEELQEVIQDSIGNAEMALPGLGVLFEIIWSHSNPQERDRMVAVLHDHLHEPISS